MYGFSYRGIHSSELGIDLLSYTVHSPEVREYEDEAAGRPGSIDYGSEWGPRQIDLKIDIVPDGDPFKIRQSKLLNWLNPMKPAAMLIFDDVPGRFYLAKFNGRLGMRQFNHYGQFEFSMKCYDPFAYSVARNDEVTWGSEIITFNHDYTMGHEGGDVKTVTANTSYNVVVSGTEPVQPIITISGTGTNVKVSANGKEFTISNLDGASWIIDCQKYLVKKNGSLSSIEGEFLQLEPDDNEIIVTGSGLNFTMQTTFRDQFI